MVESFDILESTIRPVLADIVSVNHPDHGLVKYKAKRLNRAKISPERILNICANKKSMKQAMLFASQCAFSFSDIIDGCVYIIGAPELKACKVGVSQNPAKRIYELQTASPYKLRPEYLFWMPRKQCYGIEKLVHRVASKVDAGLHGEWIAGQHEVAGMITATVLASANVRLSSSGIYLENTKSMMKEISSLNGEFPSNVYSKTTWDSMVSCDPMANIISN